MCNEFDIHVKLDTNNDWLVADDITGVYGVGKTVPQALQDYQDSLQYLHLDLIDWHGGLAPHLQKIKKVMTNWFRWRKRIGEEQHE